MSCFTHNKSTLRKSRFIPILFFLLFFSLALFIACGGSSNSTEDNPAAPQTTPGDTENPGDKENPGELEKFVQRKSQLRWSGYYDVCALYDEGTPWCWSYNFLTDGGVKKITDDKYISLSAYPLGNRAELCGVRDDGKLFCASVNGNPSSFAEFLYSSTGTSTITPVQVSEGITDKTFSSIELNDHYACALEDSGKLYCWGRNESGRLGIGTDENKPREPTLVKTDLTFTDYSLSKSHVCALEPSGKAYCWGSNTNGQLGNDTTTPVNKPVAVVTDQLFRQIYNHSSITCALNKDYELYCWGKNTQLELNSKTPIKMNTNDLKFSSIDFLGNNICGISDAQELYCWGDLDNSEPASGNSGYSTTPLKVSTDIKFKRVVGGGEGGYGTLYNTLKCAISEENLLYCWSGELNSFGIITGVNVSTGIPILSKAVNGLSGKIYIPE